MAATSNGAGAVEPQLEAARRELLDLGLRNALLNYRLLKSRGVEIVDESPDELFRILVRDGRAMSFQPAPDPAPQTMLLALPSVPDTPANEPPLVQLPQPPEPPARHVDSRLQTAHPSDQLQARLLATYLAARTFVEEQGVNILYLALGMLDWREADNASTPRHAPLLLVPTELERADARDRFKVRHTGEEIGENLSLRAKLASDFGLTAPPMPEPEDLDVAAYFDAWSTTIDGMLGWSVDREAVALGFFSFGKFLMYRDLDTSNWPAHAQPGRHPVLGALLCDGFREPPSSLGDDDFLDRVAPPSALRQVVDADATQTLAILDVAGGRNLVIEGPPGTGKSQTITNLIAESLGAGKTVLFVAEKMAALEVVKRRLDAVGLGDACLELHSHKINKRAVLEELRRTLQLGKPRLAQLEADLATLEADRERLNAYAEALNTPLGDSGLTPYMALGELVAARRDPASETWPRLELPEMATWSAADYARKLAVVEELQARVARMGVPSEHPFWGARRAVLAPTDPPRIRVALDAAITTYPPLLAAAMALATMFGLSQPADRPAGARLLAVARRALAAPDMSGVAVAAPDWLARRDEIDALLDAGSNAATLRAKHNAMTLPDAWERDTGFIRQALNARGRSFFRFLSGDYRRAKRELAALCVAEPPADLDGQLTLLDDIATARRLAAEVASHSELGARLFGARWQGAASDWPGLRSVRDWITELRADVAAGALPPELPAWLDAPRSEALARDADALDAATRAWDDRLGTLLTALDFDPTFRDRAWDAQQTTLATWSERFDDLAQMAAFNASAAACRAEGLDDVVTAAQSWPEAGVSLAAALRHGRATMLLERAFRERPPLASFEGSGHEQVIARFRTLDELALEHNRARLAHAHWSSVPKAESGGQFGVLRREFEKRSRHLPIRRLMERAGNAAQAIKPVFMMSPLSIATYLSPGSVAFDLVVFDEASQVRPVDAFGALLRGAQAVVVGDSRQLPPTSFFDALTSERPELEGDEEVDTGAYESILDLFGSANAPSRMLRWHYRSRHQSLIAVSNREFYNDKLVVFPNPEGVESELGLRFHYLPSSSYERGGARVNRDEARAVATAVMRHALETPDLTLGVAAFSTPQTQAVVDELELLRRADPAAEPFFAAHPTEPFFVKNLENVQGDERDVIFISVGYGRTAEGSLGMNFGPLNATGGERRLNVLITRARLRCEVFTNLTADDIDLDRTASRGVRAFKTFLKYAQTGVLDVPIESDRPSGSPFEDAVAAELRDAGHIVHGQVGSAGFFIDLAIVDPERPGRYLLGVECDGASYHSARSVRDRDRLRQQVLERLGWRIHRVWSTDWFRNPRRELQRVTEAIEAAKSAGYVARAGSGPSPPTEIVRDAAGPPATTRLPGYTLAAPRVRLNGADLPALPAATLAGWLAEVVAVESPVHVTEACRRVLDTAGVTRMGSRIQEAFDAALTHATRAGMIRARGDFLWATDMHTPVARDRSTLQGFGRSLEAIAPEEVRLAIANVVSDAYGIAPADIAPAVVRLFGFERLTEDMRAAIDPQIAVMIAEDQLARQGEQVVVPDA